MNKLLLLVVAFSIGMCSTSLAQNVTESEYQEYLERNKARMIKKQRLIDAQHGHHFGVTLSSSPMFGSMKNGVLLFYGNRLSEHWMLQGMLGADMLTPSEVSYIDSTTDQSAMIDRPVFSFPIIAESRFYFGTSRFMPYLFMDIGASISKYTGAIFNTGLGFDINFTGSHTIFFSIGLGTTPVPKVGDSLGLGYKDQVLRKKQAFTANFRLGYYF